MPLISRSSDSVQAKKIPSEENSTSVFALQGKLFMTVFSEMLHLQSLLSSLNPTIVPALKGIPWMTASSDKTHDLRTELPGKLTMVSSMQGRFIATLNYAVPDPSPL